MCFICSCIEFTLCLYFHIEHTFGGIWNYMCHCCCVFIIRIAIYRYGEYVEGKKSRVRMRISTEDKPLGGT